MGFGYDKTIFHCNGSRRQSQGPKGLPAIAGWGSLGQDTGLNRPNISFIFQNKSTKEGFKPAVTVVIRKHRLTSVFIVLLLCLTCLALSTIAASPPPAFGGKKVIIFFFGGISLTDLAEADLPNLRSLIHRGALGIMNNRTAGAYTPANAYATLGARERAFGSADSGLVLQSDQPFEQSTAKQVFYRRTGTSVTDETVVLLDLPRLLQNNTKSWQKPDIGYFGSLLAAHGKKAAVVGNADTDKPGREFALTLINRKGIIPMGALGHDLLQINPAKPFGLETDYPRLLAKVKSFIERADVIGVELGDTSRLEKYRSLLTPERYRQLAREGLQSLDRFIGLVEREITPETALMLWVSPFPSEAALSRGEKLLPVILTGPGVTPGILYSASTRWPGIISGFDLQATILAHLGIPLPPELLGRPLSARPHRAALAWLQQENQRLIAVNNTRRPVLKGFVAIQIILVLAALAIILTRPGRLQIYTSLRAALAGLTAIPLALLIHPFLGFHGVVWEALYLIAFATVVGLLASRLKIHANYMIGWIALVTALSLSSDILLGSPLMRYSLLGFGPIGGARYYGIGNEYMGILLGASLTGTATVLDRFPAFKRPLVVLIGLSYAFWVYIVGAPWLGSNVGGGIALTVAYVVMLLLLLKKEIRRGRMLALAVGVALFLVATMGLTDLLRSGASQSHLGKLAQLISNSGISSAFPLFLRKIRMNLTLIEYTIWTKALLSFIIVLWVLFYRPRGHLAKLAVGFPASFKGSWSAVVGSAAALLANDSGIVSAATALLYPVVQMIQIVLANPVPGPQRNLVDKIPDKQ